MLKQCLYIPELKTKRLLLREITVGDVEDLREWLGRDEIYTYWGHPVGKGEKNPELLFIDPRPHVKRKPSHDFRWGVEYKNKVVGIIDIFDVQGDRIGNIGYRINPDYWKQGICSEALSAIIDFIFANTTIDRLHVEVDVENIGSNKVVQKCGFVHEGCIRHGRMGLRYCDYNIYGMIKDDWPNT